MVKKAVYSVLEADYPLDRLEVFVVDDGSTDQTPEILESYRPRVHVLRQENQGVAAARNRLLEHAEGDLLAWLDSDDIWHPRCLDVQSRSFRDNPDAGALFVDHVDFWGAGPYIWRFDPLAVEADPVIIDPLSFLTILISAPGKFMSAFCCITRGSAHRIGGRVAPAGVRITEDFYMLSTVALKGLSAVYAPYPLVAYRVRNDSLSRKTLPTRCALVEVFKLLDPHFRASAPRGLLTTFEEGFASARRGYAKALMGQGRSLEARREIAESFAESYHLGSLLKSAGLLAATFAPRRLQPKWPTS